MDRINRTFGYFAQGELAILIRGDVGEESSALIVSQALERAFQQIIDQGDNGSFQAAIAARRRRFQENPPPNLGEEERQNLRAALEHLRNLEENGPGLIRRFLPRSYAESPLQTVVQQLGRCDDFQSRPDPQNDDNNVAGEIGYLKVLNLESDHGEGLIQPLDRALLYLVGELNIKLRADEVLNGLEIRVITSPNWRFTSSQGSLSGGSPGAKPVPGIPIGGQFVPEFEPISVDGFNQFGDGFGSDVDVYILDTLPSSSQLCTAGSEHEHIRALFGSTMLEIDGELVCHRNEDAPVRSLHYPYHPKDEDFNNLDLYMVGCNRDEHNYDISSHGPFVAGIVHALAPDASLHLLKVLSDKGIGTLHSIEWGLLRALESHQRSQNSHFIINMSLTIGFQCECPPLVGDIVKRDICALITVFSPENENAEDVILDYLFVTRDLFDRFPENTIFAAAGNDSSVNQELATRFPALFADVIGVGALGADFERAPYSNIADDEDTPGYWAVGGDPNGEYAHSLCGLLGVYTSRVFPDGRHNRHGWARWAGTSFATPIVTGLFAAVLSANRAANVAAAKVEGRALLDDLVIENGVNGLTHIIPVRQIGMDQCPCEDPNPGGDGCLMALINLFRVDNVRAVAD